MPCCTKKWWLGLIPSLIAGMAVICSFISSFWCESVKFEANSSFQNNLITYTPKDIYLGPWYIQETEVTQVNNGGQIYYNVRDVCSQLPGDVEIDSKWKAVRAFSVMAPLIGTLLAVLIFMSNCTYYLSASGWKKVAVSFIVPMTLCQGLIFLLLNSNACSENPLLSQEPTGNANVTAAIWSDFINAVYPTDCAWASGLTVNVIATVSWFLTGASMLVVGVPVPTPREPPETQEVTYEKTVAPDGTTAVVETTVVKGTAVPAAPAGKEEPIADNP